ncbi:MAG: anaerobic ribonucleoside-triphosphate reductase activating protein [Desulfitobacteriaceae bacterium]|nr:anaerobic ribonucleoside-triphosphate reductase activating protein [Desulfitobacteriaceae bacterium]
MIIGGFTKLSTIDWPGKLAAVIFTRGCNFRCPWCHNKSLVWPELYGPEIPGPEVLAYLEKRKSYLDGVVVTGGEPTIQKDLPAFLKKIKNIGLKVKLDTNGSNPNMLEYLLQEGL